MSKKFVAKKGLTAPNTIKILGIEISGTSHERLLKEIYTRFDKKTYTKPLFIITAYSENILQTRTDTELAAAFSAG